jgi:hypothetical protein
MTDYKIPDLVSDAVKKYETALEADRKNKERAYEALRFMAGDQWDPKVKQSREDAGRPCQTINRCPSFVKQVSNDIRMAQPAVRVITVGGIGEDEPNEKRREEIARKAAETRQQLLRHVENRSDAPSIAYAKAADDVVACGYGAWRIITEYASDTSLVQEIRIVPVDDPIGIVWDQDSRLPTREDANFCFVPIDMSRAKFKELYPDAVIAEMKNEPIDFGGTWTSWQTADTIRVAEYFYRKMEKRKFVELEGRLIPAEDEDAKAALKAGGKTIERDAACIYRAVISAVEELEKSKKWVGSRIPVIPVWGEETQIRNERIRWGLIEHIKDAQRRYNYFSSAHTEIVALQPKSPFIGTDKQFADYEEVWKTANTENHAFLPYTPDPTAPGPPQRSQPPVSSQGISDGIALAAEEMKAITGIYDAALGQRSNETSGVAITARQRESDVGSYVYSQNFGRAIRHTGRVLIDLMPRIYDTTRVFRVMGVDGKIDTVELNKPADLEDAGEDAAAALLINDISAGEYDVVLEQGPSYTTKREEAKAGMIEFIRAFPDAMQVAGDLVAQAQDWPHKDEFAKRLRALIPPQVIKAAEQEDGAEEEQQQPQVPPPEVIAQQVEAEVMQRPEYAMKDAQARKAIAEAAKAELDLQAAQMAMMAPQQMPAEPMQAPAPDPMEAIRLKQIEKAALMDVDLAAEGVRRRMERDMVSAESIGLGPEAAEPMEPAGPTPVDMLAQALAAQGEAIREGMMMLAQAIAAQTQASMAPTRLVRDEKGRAIGAEKVVN